MLPETFAQYMARRFREWDDAELQRHLTNPLRRQGSGPCAYPDCRRQAVAPGQPCRHHAQEEMADAVLHPVSW